MNFWVHNSDPQDSTDCPKAEESPLISTVAVTVFVEASITDIPTPTLQYLQKYNLNIHISAQIYNHFGEYSGIYINTQGRNKIIFLSNLFSLYVKLITDFTDLDFDI